MKLKTLYSFFGTDLDIIEEELKRITASNYPLITEASLELIEAGGKRIRPVFVLLSAMFGAYNIDVVKHVAVALETIHMASLVHDDVIDDADIRRGKPTIKAKWNNRIAMYTGDYLLASSLVAMTNIENPEAHKILSKTMVEVCLGEIEQIKDKYNYEQSLRTYLKRIKRKTALLIAVSCQLGAVSAGASEDLHRKLYWFGYFVGMSFQITDDILDFTATEKELGKPVGSDLLQGNITLPVLFAMKDADIRAEIEKVSAETTADELKPIVEKIIRTDAIEKSYALSELYLEKAFAILKYLPRGRAKSTLSSIAKYIGKRKF
ncbi:heptaprenyl diphosphate synthase component II [Metabacillus fastidiosus]|uniref:Heptaprenyl diphosphate synthase component II n=1 Tax=Metabacillus fastidiosus TaxID=1458 RepID=A0ABU6NU90_9BACI|nr:heptaprenyl diphosphate synthase component II [Metabacillus fastidiosus]MED4400710.1 heptaprenyl diphosphate synthase component II [Metabacillus fastidiosus]MED4462881.1 heptaprenyl diphosphate synthase component II [Metabacillus fastidiosus]